MSRVTLAIKTVLFTVVMPGTVVGWLPWLVITSGGTPLAWYTVGERHLHGFVPLMLGEVMLSASARLLAYGAVVFGAFHLFITLYEEPKLASLFGDEFAAYRARVPRWIPRAPRGQ